MTSWLQVDVEEALAAASTYARVGLRALALQSLAEALLVGGASRADVLVVARALRVDQAPPRRSQLLSEACSYAVIGLREKGLECLVLSLLHGNSPPQSALARVLKELWLSPPTETALPRIEAEVA